MKERPILFSAPMVRAILAGRKTQTRRIVKPGPSQSFLPDGPPRNYSRTLIDTRTGEQYPDPIVRFGVSDENEDYPCPFGRPGDRLWVKETWRTTRGLDHCKPTGLAEGAPIQFDADQWREGFGLQEPGKTRVSLFMRRWMSRITLEIESVRVERLQDISHADAIAEGIERISNVGPLRAFGWKDYASGLDGHFCPCDSYRSLWNHINGAGAWDLNPWIWAITFKRISP